MINFTEIEDRQTSGKEMVNGKSNLLTKNAGKWNVKNPPKVKVYKYFSFCSALALVSYQEFSISQRKDNGKNI